jgi:hypothetical protein
LYMTVRKLGTIGGAAVNFMPAPQHSSGQHG